MGSPKTPFLVTQNLNQYTRPIRHVSILRPPRTLVLAAGLLFSVTACKKQVPRGDVWHDGPVSEQTYRKYFHGYQIVDSEAFNENEVYFLARKVGLDPSVDEMEWQLVRCWGGRWSAIEFSDLGYLWAKLAKVTLPDPRVLFMVEDGYIYSCRGDEEWEEDALGDNTSDQVVTLMDISSIGGRAYTAGLHRTVLVRTDRPSWHLQQPERNYLPQKIGYETEDDPAVPDPAQIGFSCISGFTERDIYAAGHGGDAWHFDGETWNQLDVPTEEDIESIFCAPNGRVYISTGEAELIERVAGKWERLEHGIKPAINPVDFAWFQGALFLLSGDDLFRYEEGSVSKVGTYPFDGEGSLMVVGAGKELVLSGGNTISVYDGKSWTPLLSKRHLSFSDDVLDILIKRESEEQE